MSEDMAEQQAGSSATEKKNVYMPGVNQPLQEGEEWEYDPDAYRLYRTFKTTWPCLSFDLIKELRADDAPQYPASCKIIGGTQADKLNQNELVVMKLSNLSLSEEKKQSNSDEEDNEEEENEANAENKEPILYASAIQHFGIVNRVKATNLGESTVCAVFNSEKKVQIWKLSDAIEELEKMEGRSRTLKRPKDRPVYTFLGHNCEGFGLAWSGLKTGRLASGDIRRNIHLWTMHEGGTWVVDQRPLLGHTRSVEDLVWSPVEEPLLSSCSCDGSIRLWDTRSSPTNSCVCVVENAHDCDVNVLSWNHFEPLLVSGDDNGALKVWSLKTIQYKEPVAQLNHHTKAITSVEWSPHETTMLMASGEDDQVTFWDLALEKDTIEDIPEIPPQLLFVHMGQTEVKEVHWHTGYPGMAITTALSGFNIFKPSNI